MSIDIASPIEKAVEDQASSFLKQEPVVLGHLIAGPVLGAVTLFAPGGASKPAEQISAAIVTAVIVLQGFVLRRFVIPEWKRLTGRDASGILDTMDPEPDDPELQPEQVPAVDVDAGQAAVIAGTATDVPAASRPAPGVPQA